MDKTCVIFFGKDLREHYKAPEDLPYPMRKALEALASGAGRGSNNDNVPMGRGSGEGAWVIAPPLVKKGD